MDVWSYYEQHLYSSIDTQADASEAEGTLVYSLYIFSYIFSHLDDKKPAQHKTYIRQIIGILVTSKTHVLSCLHFLRLALRRLR